MISWFLLAMSKSAYFPAKYRPKFPLMGGKNTVLLSFALIMMVVFTADSAISYLSPVVMERQLGNVMLMGVILGFSSMVGTVCDLIFPQVFGDRPYTFHFRAVLMLMLTFPMCYILLPHQPWVFVLSMAIWGVYFEFLRFTEFNFIHTILPLSDHARGWGILETFRSVGLMVGPLMSGFLLDQVADERPTLPFWGVIGVLVLAIVLYKLYELFLFKWSDKQLASQHKQKLAEHSRSFMTELKIWSKLLRRLWLVYIFFLSMVMLDTTLWSVGALLSEELRHQHWFGGLLLPAYAFPSIFLSILAGRLAKYWGKKRMAFGMSLLAGLLMGFGCLFVQNAWLVVLVLFSASCMAIAYPEIYATFEDYMARLDTFGGDLVGLQATAANIAYIVGPILASFLAVYIGNYGAIAVASLWLSGVSMAALIWVPRKIKMPMHSLERIALAGAK